jgi:tetratricopeptide (TPR) repeat protein
MSRALRTVILVAFGWASLARAQGHGGGAGSTPPPLFDDLGTYHRAITTSSESVQAYFDQGLRLLLAFNLEEAQRSFAEAAARDPRCAMCFWGLGMSLSPHYNLPGLPDRTSAGARAVANGLAVADDKPEIERDLLSTLARRLADPPPSAPEGYAALDRAYAEGMETLAKKYPDDLDVQDFYAEALMDLRPWKLWQADGSPAPGTLEIIEQVQWVLARNPDHPGANHLLIHALEASPHPERAIEAASRVARTMPGAAHMVHMPAHIWSRLGRWEEAAEVNRAAIRVDDRYLESSPAIRNGFYMMYYGHNHQFLWWSALMSGRHGEAIEEARAVAAGTPLEMLRAFPGYDFLLEYAIWTQLTFGKNLETLAEPAPPAEFAYATGVWRAARGLALLRLKRLTEAQAELDPIEAALSKMPSDALQGLNPASTLLGLARDWLAGELAIARGDVPGGLARLRAAFDTERGLGYNEPPDWYVSVAPALGRALLLAGRFDEASRVFAQDLDVYRENGWSLSGLAESLGRAGKSQEAAAARARFVAAWQRADSPPPFAVR